MTTMAMAESFDAPMMDFSGEDIPMQTSSSTSWTHPEATMDDDSTFNLGDVEIDMHTEPFEYEMADDSPEQPIEVHDVEVFDVSQAHTPALIDTVVEDVIAASPAVPEHDLTDTHDRSPLETPPILVVQVPSPTPQPVLDEGDHEIAGAEPEPLGQSEWDQGHAEPAAASSPLHSTEGHQPQVQPVDVEDAAEPASTWSIDVPVEQQIHLRQPSPIPVEQLQLDSSHEESAHDLADNWDGDENHILSHDSSGDPHEVSDGIFIDPPPPVILSLGDSEEEYYLFNRPPHKSPAADDGGVTDGVLFLHDLPTLYYEPLAKVFQTLRSDGRLAQCFDLSRGELAIDAYDLVDLVISEDNSYTNEVSFHDLNLLHDHADLAGPLRIRVECHPRRFIARYRELKAKLEQFNLLDETNTDDPRLREHYDPVEQPDARDYSDYPTQNEESNESLSSEVHDQTTAEQQTNDPGSAAHAAGNFDEGESSNDAEPEQAQPTDDEGSTVGPLSGDECTEKPVGLVEDCREQGATVVTDSDGSYPVPAEDLDAATVHEPSDDHGAPPLGEISTECEKVVVTNEDYESDLNEIGQGNGHGEIIAIEGDAGDTDWETTAPDVQHTQDYPEQYKGQDDAKETDKHSDIFDLTVPNPDDDHTAEQQDTDTDSIGQRTLDEFADAQEETRGRFRPHEEEDSNSTTDQSNELNPDPDQLEYEFNWDEGLGDFDGEFDEFDNLSNVETNCANPQGPTPGKSSKRAFDEIDSDTADENETQGDVSPNSKRKKVL